MPFHFSCDLVLQRSYAQLTSATRELASLPIWYGSMNMTPAIDSAVATFSESGWTREWDPLKKSETNTITVKLWLALEQVETYTIQEPRLGFSHE